MTVLAISSEEYDNIVRLVDTHIKNGYHINRFPSFDLSYSYVDFWKSVYKQRLKIFIKKLNDYEISEYVAANRILEHGSAWRTEERNVFLSIVNDVKSSLVLNLIHISRCNMIRFSRILTCPVYLKINLSEIQLLEKNISWLFDEPSISGFIFEDMDYGDLIKIYQIINQYLCNTYSTIITSSVYDINFSPIVIRHIIEIFKRVSPFSVKVSKLTDEIENHPLFLCHKKFLKFDKDEDSVYFALKYGY